MRTRIHINLGVADLDRSIAFYTHLFGTPPTKVRDDYANWRLDAPGLHLALVSKPGGTHADPTPTERSQHFGVELFENAELNTWRERAAAAGLSLRTEEKVTCCYAVANKFWAADPDGHDWEFWVRSDEAEFMHDEPGSAAAMPLETVTPQASADT